MTKEQKATVVEYAAQLPEEDLRYLSVRLIERLSGDLAEALDFMSRSRKMDDLLSASASANELFTNCDQIRDVFSKECKKRVISLRYIQNAA